MEGPTDFGTTLSNFPKLPFLIAPLQSEDCRDALVGLLNELREDASFNECSDHEAVSSNLEQFSQLTANSAVFTHLLHHDELAECELSSCDLNRVVLSGKNLKRSQFRNSALMATKWDGVLAEELQLDGTDNRWSTAASQMPVMSCTRMSSANLSGSKFYRPDFSRGTFSNVQFRGADLTGANFDSAHLKDCDFRGANLTDASFANCRFTGIIDFSFADMRGVNLTGVQHMVRANIYRAHIDLSKFDQYRTDRHPNEPALLRMLSTIKYLQKSPRVLFALMAARIIRPFRFPRLLDLSYGT